MTIHLPRDLEVYLRAEVNSGHFPSLDDAIAEAVRMLLAREHSRTSPAAHDKVAGVGLIGALRDDAAMLDQAVEHAMKVREERPWRLPSRG